MTAQVTYDPLDFEALDNPYAVYRELRDQYPVYWNPEREVFALSRYDDVVAAARAWREFSNTPGVDLDDGPNTVFGEGDFVNLDPPRHDILRKVLHPYFTPRAVKELESFMELVSGEIIDGFQDREEVDLAEDFAWEMPVRVIAHILGMAPADQPHLRRLARTVTLRASGSTVVPIEARDAAGKLGEYFADLTARMPPASAVLTGILSAVRAERVAPEEVSGLAIMLFVAGMETTASLIATALVELSQRRDLQVYLRQHPEVTGAAVEEFLRYDAPVQRLARTATSALQLHGISIPSGSRVVLIFGSANRDDRHFSNPDTLDFKRPSSRHLAFGEGIHFCLGAPLARLETRIALRCFLRRVRDFELVGQVHRHPTYTSRVIASAAFRLMSRAPA